MHQIKNEYYCVKIPDKHIKQYFVYAGLHALESAINMANSLNQRHPNAKTTVVSCECEIDQKRSMPKNESIQLIVCECGGIRTMAKIASDLLKE